MFDARDLLADGHGRALRYLDERDDRNVGVDPGALAELGTLGGPLPDRPSDPAETIAVLDRVGSPGTVQTNGARYFGFVTGGAQPIAMSAAAIGAAWDQNAALPAMSPTAATLDEAATGWVIDILGLPSGATGTFCGGASEANLIAMITGRDAVLAAAGWDGPGQGLVGAPPIRVIASAETHVSMEKAVALAGLGRDRIERVPTDDQGRTDPSAFATVLAAGDSGPTIVALQAGNVNTGHSDSFRTIIPVAREAGAWVHIDGAFGLWAAAAPARAEQVAGLELADSWAIDAHKWLNVTYDSALAIVADGRDLARSMRADAAYLPSGGAGSRAPMHLGLQMSQRARAIEVWAVLRTLGRTGVAELVERSCVLASRFAERLADNGAEVLHDVVLNQALVSFGTDDETDRVIAAVQDDGTCWVGGTTWQGRRAMRLSVSGWETSENDVDVSADAIVRCWQG